MTQQEEAKERGAGDIHITDNGRIHLEWFNLLTRVRRPVSNATEAVC